MSKNEKIINLLLIKMIAPSERMKMKEEKVNIPHLYTTEH